MSAPCDMLIVTLYEASYMGYMQAVVLHRTFCTEAQLEGVQQRDGALRSEVEPVEVEPGGLQRDGLLHRGHQLRLLGAAVHCAQQRHHHAVRPVAAEGQWAPVGILQCNHTSAALTDLSLYYPHRTMPIRNRWTTMM